MYEEDRDMEKTSFSEKAMNIWKKFPLPIKWLLGIFGTIFVGALSNPFWDFCLLPFFSFLSNLMVNITIKVSAAMEVIIYTGIARYNILVNTAEIKGILQTFIIILSLFMLSYNAYLKIRTTPIKNRPNKNYKKLELWRSRIIKFNSVFLIIYILFVSALMIEDFYIAQKKQDFNYKLEICSPYIETQELLLIKSKFLLIKNQKDYDKIMNSLDQILAQNNIKL